MLTPKQHKLLVFVHNYIQTTGYAPSFEEMFKAMDLHSKSGIHRMLDALVERGFVRRIKSRARAIEVIKLPADMVQEKSEGVFAGMKFISNPAVPEGEVWFSQRGQVVGKIKNLAVG